MIFLAGGILGDFYFLLYTFLYFSKCSNDPFHNKILFYVFFK